ncbi:MAG TPA: xylulokinase [Aggregatilinea sp.]|uniref:xylulokinase n=1 Tax=Aggregatilinea sp. TaxID=2806333 RepID=UPI002BE8E3AE|nr:xylulokinase [Aggregatilinea sp.]HML21027.1 xylulokinase [Aggregatilinea sp.]
MQPSPQHIDIVLGIDVGTQSAKCVVLDANGQLRGVGQTGYPVLTPRTAWAEQDPDAWWAAVTAAVREALRQTGIAPVHVQGIGLTGQMHGAVLVGANLEPLRPALIWMDRRSASLCDEIQSHLSPAQIAEIAGNRLSPGFAGASLAWLAQAEPETLAQTRAVLQPKDYLALRLTGEIVGEPSDASATWLFDIRQRKWSPELAAACGVTTGILPPVSESASVIGRLRPDAAEQIGLRTGIPVIAGAADQAALLVGVGVAEPGRGSITLGTGGQVTVISSRPQVDPGLRLNTFCHAIPGRWYTMGAILNGGIALRWWRNTLSRDGSLNYNDMTAEAARVPAGAEDLTFLPYLEGERTPHMDPSATGTFHGLTLRHTPAHMTRAVLEGVAYAFRDCLDTLRAAGPVPDHFLIGGGGSQSALWRQIIADVLGVGLQTVLGSEHTALGAAMLAGVGSKVFYDLDQAIALAVRYGPTEQPNSANAAVYAEGLARYRALYPALRAIE